MYLEVSETYECDEESQDQDDGQRPASFEHGARLVDVHRPWAVGLTSIRAKRSQVEVQAAAGEAGAVRIRDTAQRHDASDQSAHEAEVDECDEEGIVPGPEVVE